MYTSGDSRHLVIDTAIDRYTVEVREYEMQWKLNFDLYHNTQSRWRFLNTMSCALSFKFEHNAGIIIIGIVA